MVLLTLCTACRDSDHKVTKGDVTSAIGPLMHTAQAGMVFMGSSGGPGGDPQKGTSVWEDFRDSMRELATDQMAAAIANGAFDEVDAQHTGRIEGATWLAAKHSYCRHSLQFVPVT